MFYCKINTSEDSSLGPLLLIENKEITHLLPNRKHMEGKKGNVLFNDAFNTFYIRLYGVGHMVKNHLDSEKKLL